MKRLTQKGGFREGMFTLKCFTAARFRLRFPLLVLVISALLFAGAPAWGAELAGEINFLSWGDEARFKAVLDDFRQKYPAIKLNYIGGPYGEHLDKFKTMVASGAPPDIALIDGYDYATLAAQGLLMDLTTWAERDGILEELREQLHPAYLQEMTYQGRLYSIAPMLTGELGFFYNKDILSEVGYPDLKALGANWTWDAFVELAQLATKDVDGNGTFDRTGFSPADWQFWPWVLMNGGRLISEDMSYSPFDAAEAYEALQFLSDLRNVYRVTSGGNLQRWLDGSVAMREGWVSAETNSLASSAINWDMAYFPAGKAGSVTISKGNELVIPYNAINKELAWEFMKYAASEEAYYLHGANRSFFPPRRDAAVRVLELGGYPEFIREFMTQADIRPLPVINGFRAVYDIWVAEMRPLWGGQVSAREAGQRVAERTRIALSEARGAVANR